MCGRICDPEDPELDMLLERLGIDPWPLKRNRDLRPSQETYVITSQQNSLEGLKVVWGYKPSWAKRPLINAQAETVATKPTFRKQFESNRCIKPCAGWYEWRDEGGPKKQKYFFSHVDSKNFYMAGIWYSEEQPKLITLTTAPNERCAEIHNRMPVLIPEAEIEAYLRAPKETLGHLLQAYPADDIQITAQ